MEYLNPVWIYDEQGQRSRIKCEGECFIPIDPANRHYAKIMRLVDAGELVIAEPD